MIKRLLLLPLFFVITTTVAQANTASKQVSTFIIPHHNYKPRRKYGVPKGLYKFNKEIFRSIYARRSEFI
jgi:hypothetical protein